MTNCEHILKFIRDAGRAGRTAIEIGRFCLSINCATRTNRLSELQRHGLIESEWVEPPKGQRYKRYFATEALARVPDSTLPDVRRMTEARETLPAAGPTCGDGQLDLFEVPKPPMYGPA